jgi:hypothetical protein
MGMHCIFLQRMIVFFNVFIFLQRKIPLPDKRSRLLRRYATRCATWRRPTINTTNTITVAIPFIDKTDTRPRNFRKGRIHKHVLIE